MWFTLVSILYVLVCAFLILVVLLQQGKGGGIGSALGGAGGSNTVFGAAGAGNFLTRLTAVAATSFMVLSAVLAYMSTSGDREFDVVEQVENEQRETEIGGDGEDGEAAPETTSDTEEEAVPLTTEDLIEQETDDALDELEEGLDGLDEGTEDVAPDEGGAGSGEGDAPGADAPEADAPEAAAPTPAPAAPAAPAAGRVRPRPQPQAVEEDEPPAAQAPPSGPFEEDPPTE
ncbi:MAG: preprotein translocase subunit SecG [Sandaracinaceae bacterium]